MRLDQAARSFFLVDIVSAFSWRRYFFKPKVTLDHPLRRGLSRPAFAASLHCGVIQMGRSAA